MQTNEPRLKVQSGERVFGPMSLTDLAELLAAERFSGSDLVSDGDGPWVTIEEYVARQSEPPATPAPPPPAPSDDDFAPVFDSAPPATERQPSPPPPDDEPLFKPPEPGGPDSDYMLQTNSGEEESDYVPLSESLDPSPSSSGGPSSADADSFHHVEGRPAPTEEPPELVPPQPPPRRPPPPAADFPEYDEPSPPATDETALDDILQALAQDEADAPEVKLPPRKRTTPKGPGRGNAKRKRKRR